jgi:hypothetical protein
MIKQYYDKFMVWQLHNRRELVFFAVGFIVGAVII